MGALYISYYKIDQVAYRFEFYLKKIFLLSRISYIQWNLKLDACIAWTAVCAWIPHERILHAWIKTLLSNV